ncbi:Centromere protein K, partial [Opisthocomus hoazin]
KCQSKLMLLGKETVLKSDDQLSLLTMQVKALTAEYNQWQNRSPEIISTNPDVLLALGKEELLKVKNDLEMVLSTVKLKNKQLVEDLKREQQWLDEQEQLLHALNGLEEETKTQAERLPRRSTALNELQNKMLKIQLYREELLNALGEFLEDHFPLPEKGASSKKKVRFSSLLKSSCFVYFLNLIVLLFQILINKLMSTPHEPYVTINESFWPPYLELLLRYGIALRHPEDPNRIRLEAFH